MTEFDRAPHGYRFCGQLFRTMTNPSPLSHCVLLPRLVASSFSPTPYDWLDVIYMAHGISLFKRYQNNRAKPSEEIQHFLNSFNRGRLGIRIMVGHHLALHHQFNHPNEATSSAYLSMPSSAHSRRIGIIEPQCDIEALILKAAQSAQFVFFQHYNTVFPPSVHIEHAKEAGGRNIRFPVVPALLHHILFELLKNSMRATAEFHGLNKMSYPGTVQTD